jgi:predicted NAD/FAD-binding protein
VTLNPTRAVAEEDIFDEHEFFHPVFDRAAIEAQSRLKALQGIRNTWFCGAYMGHGFHEDGLASAMAVAARLGASAPWLDHTAVTFPERVASPPEKASLLVARAGP